MHFSCVIYYQLSLIIYQEETFLLIFFLFLLYFKECFSISSYVFCRLRLISFFDFSLLTPINSCSFLFSSGAIGPSFLFLPFQLADLFSLQLFA